jgi:hypothetical protein
VRVACADAVAGAASATDAIATAARRGLMR